MAKRSLSKRESDLILALEWDNQRWVSLKDIIRRLRCSYGYARKMAHVLRRKGWLEPMAKGHYLLIGADRGPKGLPEMNPYLVTRFLPKPYFLAYRFACTHHGLLTQVPSVIHVAVTRPKRPLELKNVRFEFIVLSKKRFFGFQEATVFGEKINVSDLERTVLDAFVRPDLVGGIESAAQALFQASKKFDRSQMLTYLKRMKDSALARRFGYLAELFQVKLSNDLAAYLKTQATKNPAFLGSPKRWGTQGERNKLWNLILNVPKAELMGEVRIG